jgi:SAP domain
MAAYVPVPVPVPKEEFSSLVRAVQNSSLLNRQLSSICQVNGLKTTGVKAELQTRIINRELSRCRALFSAFLASC